MYGDIVCIKLVPGKSCGFVQYFLRPCAEMALKQLNGQYISWNQQPSALTC